jgi:hypothetical protein
VRSWSAMKYAVSVCFMRTRARTTIPVRPIPAIVAQNRSLSSPDGVSVRMDPSAVSRSSASTWLPKLPCEWWFLPWMSAPMAPPIVTCLVPGSTGTQRPWGRTARIRVSRLTPASRSTIPESGSMWWMRLSAVMSTTSPPAFCAGSP